MFHSNTQHMIDYWRGKSGLAGAPARSAIDPTEFARLAPQALMLGRAAAGIYPIRLAGGLVCDLHLRDLRGMNFLALVAERGRFDLQTALETARRRPEPLVAEITAVVGESALALELFLAPLAARAGSPERFLGLYQPLSLVSRLEDAAVAELHVRAIHGVGPANEETHRLRLATLDGRRVA